MTFSIFVLKFSTYYYIPSLIINFENINRDKNIDFLKFINIIIYCLLENLDLQNLDHLLSFCNDQHFWDNTFLVNETSNVI